MMSPARLPHSKHEVIMFHVVDREDQHLQQTH